MTFYTDDEVNINYIKQTGYWVLILNGKGVRDAKRESTLRDYVAKNTVNWARV